MLNRIADDARECPRRQGNQAVSCFIFNEGDVLPGVDLARPMPLRTSATSTARGNPSMPGALQPARSLSGRSCFQRLERPISNAVLHVELSVLPISTEPFPAPIATMFMLLMLWPMRLIQFSLCLQPYASQLLAPVMSWSDRRNEGFSSSYRPCASPRYEPFNLRTYISTGPR
jgi:hypothetical protein